MSTEVASFKKNQVSFTRFGGSPKDKRASGSEFNERLAVTLMLNNDLVVKRSYGLEHVEFSLSCEEAMELGRRLMEMFPVNREPVMRPFLYENEGETTLVYAEDEALAWQQVADDHDWEEDEDEGTMRPLSVSKTPASFILSI